MIYLSLFILGLLFGGLAGALVYRVPRGYIRGFPACPACGKRIRPYDLVPVCSFLLLMGKCRDCGGRISPQYGVIELVMGMLACAAFFFHGLTAHAALVYLVWCVLAVISFIDMEHMIIPNGLVVALAVLCAAYAALGYGEVSVISRVIGALAVSLPMLLLTLAVKDAFGGGDMKLIAVCGFLLGWRLVLVAGFFAIVMGGFYGIYIKYIKQAENKHIAFGQYLCFGVVIAMSLGERVLGWYVGLIFR